MPSCSLVSPLLALRSQPDSLERAHKEADGAAILAAGGDDGHTRCAMGILWSPELCADHPTVSPPRRCSCIAASSYAGRWTRPRAVPRAAGDACAG